MNCLMKKIYWLTGLPCSGKSTIAEELSRHLNAEILDGDQIRAITNNNDFSREGRANHIKSVAAMANLLSKYTHVVVALVSPLRSVREEVKMKYPNVYEIYLKCDLRVYRARDVKGMYARAMKGEIDNFTGVQDQYEEPLNPDMMLRTDDNSIDECVKEILTLHDCERKGLLIGRWQPLHEGHKWLVEQVQKKGHNVLLGIRQTPIDNANPYSVQERIDMIREMFGDSIDYVVLPDISGIYYGRDVGYEVEELEPSEKIAAISATEIRSKVMG